MCGATGRHDQRVDRRRDDRAPRRERVGGRARRRRDDDAVGREGRDVLAVDLDPQAHEPVPGALLDHDLVQSPLRVERRAARVAPRPRRVAPRSARRRRAPPRSSAAASSGSTSVRNPSRPTFTPSTGTPSSRRSVCARAGTCRRRRPRSRDRSGRRGLGSHGHARAASSCARSVVGRRDGRRPPLVHHERDPAHVASPRLPRRPRRGRRRLPGPGPERTAGTRRCPRARAAGEAIAARAPEPERRRRSRPRRRARAPTPPGSRTTPPAPTDAFARLELRLHQDHERRRGRGESLERRAAPRAAR